MGQARENGGEASTPRLITQAAPRRMTAEASLLMVKQPDGFGQGSIVEWSLTAALLRVESRATVVRTCQRFNTGGLVGSVDQWLWP